MNARLVTLAVRLTENEEPLLGSRAWVAKVIEESELRICHTKSNENAVFLVHPVGFKRDSDLKPKTQQCMALWGDHACREYSSERSVYVDPWPFWDAGSDGRALTLFGVTLTSAGRSLTSDFAKKCKTVLRLALRRGDAATKGALKVRLVSA